MDLDVKLKAVMIGAVFLIVSQLLFTYDMICIYVCEKEQLVTMMFFVVQSNKFQGVSILKVHGSKD